ncbi:hypothetical protein QTO34_004142 [Cnephaeus nilssonii]|uniref:L1 transposable element RRM domain-containing protein n=1 Tax=Cnephaeus nilssonii TaxID=3371016 RepID=A0AA40HSS0_CNENI|nr:hypothetical protein QTO34_004142 [Eptesicus nilssonii]
MGKRNNSQRKENVESPRKEINENEACNMTEKEFRVMVMEFIHRMDEKINNLCKNQEEMKSDIATIKNTMESFNSRLQEAEDRISELEDQVQKQAQAEQQLEEKIKKQEESLRELRDNMKRSNMRIIGLPEGQEEQQGLENLFEEIMTENFPDMGKIKVTQVKRVPSRINPKRPTPRHVIISMANIKDKERILKAARERQRVTYKGTPIRLSNDYSSETQQARSEWKEVYKVLQSKGLNPRILYPARLSIKIEGEIRSFADKKSLREFITTKPAMQELLKGILAKDKERILKAAREKQLITYKGAPIRLSADFSTETMQARREWQEIFKVMNSKNLQPRLLYPAKLSFRIEGQIKSFTAKKKLKEFITAKPALYEMLKGKNHMLNNDNTIKI